jgi:signal transduction histidine kinase
VIKNYGILPLITCYAGQLNQVFMNLLANAIDALEDVDCAQDCLTSQPQITIHTEIVGGHGVRISIADNGVGMTESVRALYNFSLFLHHQTDGQRHRYGIIN